MAKTSLKKITITGSGLHEIFRGVKERIVMDFKSSTYHRMIFPDGKFLDYNDFGVRAVLEELDGE